MRKTGSPTVNPATTHLIPSPQTGFLVTLNRGSVSFQFDNLSHQTIISHSNQFIHTRTGHMISNNHYSSSNGSFQHTRSRHLQNVSEHALFFFIIVGRHFDKSQALLTTESGKQKDAKPRNGETIQFATNNTSNSYQQHPNHFIKQFTCEQAS